MTRDALFVAAVEKGFNVLEAFADGVGELTLTDLTHSTGYSMATVQRITATLEECGYIERKGAAKPFRLTHRPLDLLHSFLMVDPLVKSAWPRLIRLGELTRQRVSLAVLEETSIIYLLRIQGFNAEFGAALIGRRVPAYCTSGGRVILSRLPDSEMERILEESRLEPLTPHTATEPNQIRTKISQAAQLGYAITDQEFLLGEVNAAAPILDRFGKAIAAIVVSAPSSEWSAERLQEEVIPLLFEATRAISA